MKRHIQDRREFLVGASLGLIGSACAQPRKTPRAEVSEKFSALETKLGGRLGIVAVDTASGARLAYRAGERFAMCSTFKLLLAAAILANVQHGKFTLNQLIPFSAADLLDHAPVAKAHLLESKLSIEALTAAIIEVSDNTAANLLLRLIDGPAGLTRYLRELGDDITRLDRFETELNSNQRGDARDTTTPEAIVATMQRLLVGDALTAESRNKLISWMKNCSTGLERLRAGFPAGWIIGDKTGSGANGAVNDVAIIWPPGRAPKSPPILVASYMSESTRPLAELNAAHAEIGRVIAAAFS